MYDKPKISYEVEEGVIFGMRLTPPVANNFNLPGHSLEEYFEIVLFEHPMHGSKIETVIMRLEKKKKLMANLLNLWKEIFFFFFFKHTLDVIYELTNL